MNIELTTASIPTRTGVRREIDLGSSVVADPRLRNTWNKIYAIQNAETEQLKVLVVGDSVANSKPQYIIPQLKGLYGQAGGMSTYETSGDVTSISGEYEKWFTGDLFSVGVGGELAFGEGGFYGKADKIVLFYSKSPGGGSFKVQSQKFGESWVDEVGYTDVDTNNTSVSIGVIELTKNPNDLNKVRVVGLTGDSEIIFCDFQKLTTTGVKDYPSALAKGGLLLTNALLCADGVLEAFLENIQPDIIFFEMKEGDAAQFAIDLAQMQTRFDAVLPDADWVFIESTPIEVNNNVQVAENEALRFHSNANSRFCFDGYTPCGSYAEMVKRGWEGDGIHADEKCNGYLASYLWLEMGLYAVLPSTVYGKVLRGLTGNLEGPLTFKIDTNTETGRIFPDPVYKFDLNIQAFRNVLIGGFKANFLGNEASEIPNNCRVGSTYETYLGSGTDRLVILRHQGNGNRGDLECRQLFATGLPTLDPNIQGALWNDGGTVKISAG